jgi:heme exporter protein B
MKAVIALIRRDCHLAMRRKAEALTVLFFFAIVASLFPLGVGSDPGLLRKIAPGILWVAALLSTMLGLSRMFESDYLDGCLEQMALSPTSFVALTAGKITAHWLVYGLPLVLLSPLLGVQFGLPADALFVLVAALLLGTPLLSLIGAICAALTLGVRGGGLLMSLLVLPLYVPALVFGAGAVESHVAGLEFGGHLSLLAALLLLAVLLAPWATAAALKIALE